jgi:hypothetical protein
MTIIPTKNYGTLILSDYSSVIADSTNYGHIDISDFSSVELNLEDSVNFLNYGQFVVGSGAALYIYGSGNYQGVALGNFYLAPNQLTVVFLLKMSPLFLGKLRDFSLETLFGLQALPTLLWYLLAQGLHISAVSKSTAFSAAQGLATLVAAICASHMMTC